jgi:hypothetical protein
MHGKKPARDIDRVARRREPCFDGEIFVAPTKPRADDRSVFEVDDGNYFHRASLDG